VYGSRASIPQAMELRYEPPLGMPLSMQPGQALEREQKMAMTLGGAKQATTHRRRFAYIGRESLQTPLGTLDTCHFRVSMNDSPYFDVWQAAGGPYRGHMVRTLMAKERRDPEAGVLIEVLKIDYASAGK
jgi:hypothetical protein